MSVKGFKKYFSLGKMLKPLLPVFQSAPQKAQVMHGYKQLEPASTVWGTNWQGQPVFKKHSPALVKTQKTYQNIVQQQPYLATRANKEALKSELFSAAARGEVVHAQPWRNIASLTQYGTQVAGPFAKLGSTALLDVKSLFAFEFNDSVAAMITPNWFSLMYDCLEILRNEVFRPVQWRLRADINRLVPLKSGALRSAYLSSIEDLTGGGDSQSLSFPMYMVLHAGDLEYQRPVNNMPTTSLERSGTAPEAVQHHWQRLISAGRSFAKRLYMQTARIRLQNHWQLAQYIQDGHANGTLSPHYTAWQLVQQLISANFGTGDLT
jgi:hypothetical protein